MTSMLPLSGLRRCLAVEVDALSERSTPPWSRPWEPLERGIGPADYAAAYRRVGRREERERQLELIGATGEALEAPSKKAFVRGA